MKKEPQWERRTRGVWGPGRMSQEKGVLSVLVRIIRMVKEDDNELTTVTDRTVNLET